MTQFNGVRIELDLYRSNKYGECSEINVSTLLFQMSSSDLTHDHIDSILIPEKTMFLVMKTYRTKTFSEFTFYIYSEYGVNQENLGKLLEEFGLIPENIELIYMVHYDDPPLIIWNGGRTGTSFPLTDFTIIFSHPDGNFTYLQADLTSHHASDSITYDFFMYYLTTQEWRTLKQRGGIKRIQIYGYQRDFHYNGPMYSRLHSISPQTILLSPSVHNFPEKYVLENEHTETYIPISNGHLDYTIGINRLRAGYIDNKYLTLSPRHSKAGVAYMEYQTGFPIYKVSIELGLWGPNEMLYAHTSTAVIQYRSLYTDEWTDVLDLINDICLPVDKDHLTTYNINLPGAHEFRIYMTSLASGTNNRGRLCIGDIILN